MERRRNLDQEYLSSVQSSSTTGSSSSTGTVTIEHTSEAAAGFASLLRQRKIKAGDKESARIVDVGPGRSIVDALKRGYYGNSRGAAGSHLFRSRDDDDEAVQGPDRLGWRTFLAAVVLLLIGVVLLVLGLRVYLRSHSDAAHNGLEMIILGCLCKYRIALLLSVCLLMAAFYSVFAWDICGDGDGRRALWLAGLSVSAYTHL